MCNIAFIVGIPRSGTTLLAECLARHPNISVTPETHFFRRFCRSAKSAEKALPRERAAYIRTEISAALDDPANKAIPATSSFKTEDNPSLKSLIKGILAEYRKIHDCKILIEKTPDHLLQIPAIRACFPDAKFIHIVRDPRDVALSWQGVPWNPAGILWPGWKWRTANADALACFEELPGNTITVRYEDLLSDPQSTLTAVIRFLGLPEAPKIHARIENSIAKTFDGEKEPWKENASEPIIKNNSEKWRTDMPPETRYLYDRMMGKWLSQFGYSRSDETILSISIRRLCLLILKELLATGWHVPISAGKHLGLIKR